MEYLIALLSVHNSSKNYHLDNHWTRHSYYIKELTMSYDQGLVSFPGCKYTVHIVMHQSQRVMCPNDNKNYAWNLSRFCPMHLPLASFNVYCPCNKL